MQIIVDGIDTHYTRTNRNAAEKTLLLHGWGQDLTAFNALKNNLPESKDYITLSLPGFGNTENPKTAWSITNYANFVRNFLDKLTIKQPTTIIAHSFGGRIAIKAIATEIIQPKNLILISSAGASKTSKLKRTKTILTKLAKSILTIPPLSINNNWLKTKLSNAISSQDYKSAGDLRTTFIKVINEDLKSDAKKITIPTQLIWGEKDKQTPLSEGKTLHNLIRNSKLTIIKDANHFAIINNPKKVAKIINNL